MNTQTAPALKPYPASEQDAQLLEARLADLQENQARLEAALNSLADRLADLAQTIQATQAFGWDYVALTRRLTALEDQLARSTTPRGS